MSHISYRFLISEEAFAVFAEAIFIASTECHRFLSMSQALEFVLANMENLEPDITLARDALDHTLLPGPYRIHIRIPGSAAARLSSWKSKCAHTLGVSIGNLAAIGLMLNQFNHMHTP